MDLDVGVGDLLMRYDWQIYDRFSHMLHGAVSILLTRLPILLESVGQSNVRLLVIYHFLRHVHADTYLHLSI